MSAILNIWSYRDLKVSKIESLSSKSLKPKGNYSLIGIAFEGRIWYILLEVAQIFKAHQLSTCGVGEEKVRQESQWLTEDAVLSLD